MPDDLDLATVEVARFEPLLNEKFSALSWGAPPAQTPVELALVRVLAHPTTATEGRRLPFSLFFNGPAAVPLEQATYTLVHPQLGEMSLFLVPVARKNDCIQLQAVLN